MKKILTLAAVAAALACCAPDAQASLGIITNYTALNVSFIFTTNGPATTNDGVVTVATGKVKWDNATLLNIFAHWTTNYTSGFPKGAKLVIGWDPRWDFEPLVVDKSGTNVLFDTDQTGTNAYFSVSLFGDQRAFSEKESQKSPGAKTVTANEVGSFEFSDPGVYLHNTVINGVGNETTTFTQNWNKNADFTTWSLKIDLGSFYSEVVEYLGEEDSSATASGSITTDGGGKGENIFWYLNSGLVE